MFSEFFPLELFPQGSLNSSVITTVWVGVFVVAFFNLRLGWVMSGLVVPGYMVPLIIMKPWSAGVVFVEAFVTYFIVRFLSDDLSRLGWWSSLFGRDRFFAIVLVSVMVRLSFDGYLLPHLGEVLENQWGLQFDYRNNLYSFGLIVIALIANLMWKTGFWRGLVPLTVTVGVTYLIVRYGLMLFTNFSLSNVGYMYEDLAASVLATPKAYIILLTAAFIASRMNLHYGWDFNGILMPSLIALQWYQPQKIVTTFVEAFVILGIGILLLRSPLFANVNVEGARKLLLFFNIGFVYKLVLGYLVLWFMPDLKITDTYAFGYLLATLIAIKMHDKDIAARLTRATLQTSIVAVLLASLIGFSLTLIPGWEGTVTAATTTNHFDDESLRDRRLIDLVREDKVASYRPRQPFGVDTPLPGELTQFKVALNALAAYGETGDEALLEKAAAHLAQVNYRLYRVADRYLYLREQAPGQGWGTYVFDPQAQSQLMIEAPAPLEERGSADAATVLFTLSEGRALAIGGSRRDVNPDGSADVLNNPQTFYHLFHHTLARRDVLQVRGYTSESARVLAGLRRDDTQIQVPELASRLWVRASLPPSLDLAMLKEVVAHFEIHWRDSPLLNRQRDATRKGFAELMLNRDAIRKLTARSISDQQAVRLQVSEQQLQGYLQTWLAADKDRIAGRGTNRYMPPRLDELLFFDEEVLTPLWRIVHEAHDGSRWTPEGEAELRAISIAAATLGYELLQHRHAQSGREYLILAEAQRGAQRRYWGTYVLRLGAAEPYLVQVPRPLYEINSFEYAMFLFERLDAKALLIAGANPKANLDGSADIVKYGNMTSLFTLASQVMLRESHDQPMMVIHSRAFGRQGDALLPEEDIMLSLYNGVRRAEGLSLLAQRVAEALDSDGLSYRFVDGSPQTAGYEVGSLPQSMYMDASVNKDFAVVWASPRVRASYRQQRENRQQAAQFAALDVLTVEDDLPVRLTQAQWRAGGVLPDGVLAQIKRYVTGNDVVSLARLLRQWPALNYLRIIDRDSQQAFLQVNDERGQVMAVANLAPRDLERTVMLSASTAIDAQARHFIDSRAAVLRPGGPR